MNDLVIFLAGWSRFSPARMILIILVSLLWLLCFSSLFTKDKRKMRVGYRNIIKAKLLRFRFSEKRGHPRVPYPMAVKYRLFDGTGPQTDAAFKTANAINVSMGGILVSADADIPAGSQIELKLNIQGTERPLTVRGTVVRKEKDTLEKTHTMGVSFITIEPADRAKLATFIKKNL